MAYRAHPAQDIVVGSRWPSKHDRGIAIVRASASGYVEYEREDGRRGHMHHARFREAFTPPYNANEVRSQFSMSLANLSAFHAFWSPQLRRMYARSATAAPEEVTKAARGRPALPPTAVYVGTYTSPYSPEGFLADLNDVLASISAGFRPAGV